MNQMMLRMWLVLFCALSGWGQVSAQERERIPVKAAYIPLADHYPGIVAYEQFRDQMEHADYSIEQMKSWRLLRAYFRSGEVDLAFIISPMALEMFAEQPDFRWVSLIHRDGNALAVNEILANQLNLSRSRMQRKPDAAVARTIQKIAQEKGRPVQVGVPSLLATHTVILYKYLKEHGVSMSLGVAEEGKEVVALTVPPPRSPQFIKRQNSRGVAAAFEQSLPWADVVETGNYGRVAWYSKDVLRQPKGHVECIIIATDEAIRTKREAIAEVIHYIQQAGVDLDHARKMGGVQMDEMARLINKHIPAHNPEAILASLDHELNVIHYHDLDVDVEAMRELMQLAVEGGVLKQSVDLEQFTDDSFSAEYSVVHRLDHAEQEQGH